MKQHFSLLFLLYFFIIILNSFYIFFGIKANTIPDRWRMRINLEKGKEFGDLDIFPAAGAQPHSIFFPSYSFLHNHYTYMTYITFTLSLSLSRLYIKGLFLRGWVKHSQLYAFYIDFLKSDYVYINSQWRKKWRLRQTYREEEMKSSTDEYF